LPSEILIGVKIDLDLLSLFPQRDVRIMRGMERKGKIFKVNNGGEKKEEATSLWGRRGPSKNDFPFSLRSF
jgi:hypothetical protein